MAGAVGGAGGAAGSGSGWGAGAGVGAGIGDGGGASAVGAVGAGSTLPQPATNREMIRPPTIRCATRMPIPSFSEGTTLGETPDGDAPSPVPHRHSAHFLPDVCATRMGITLPKICVPPAQIECSCSRVGLLTRRHRDDAWGATASLYLM